MIRSGLYGVLTHFIRSQSQDNELSMSIDHLTYNFQLKRGADGQNYVIIQLPFSVHNVTIMALSQGEYELKECHFTVYEGRGSEHSLLQPHFTGNYRSVVSAHKSSEWLDKNGETMPEVNQNVTLRGYVGEGDGICINSMTANTLRKNKKKPPVQVSLPNFFENELDKIKFKNHLLAYISPLMIFLCKTQADLTLPLKQEYELLLKEACALNAEYLGEKSATSIKNCQHISKKLVRITTSLANFSDGYGEWSSVQRIHQKQLEYYNVQLPPVIQVDKPELNEQCVFGENSKAQAQTNAVETIKTPSCDAWETLIGELNVLLRIKLNPSAAQRLAGVVGTLNDTLFATPALSIQQQYDFLERILAAKHHLGDYYYKALLNGEFPDMMPELLAYLPNTPSEIIYELIKQDNHEAIQALLQQDLVSIYAVADDGKPFYVHAYEQGSINSITLYAKLGIHPILMVISDVSAILNTTQIDIGQLRDTLIKYDEISVQLQETLSVLDWDVLLDNLVLTLRATKKDLLPSGNQVKHRSKPTASNTIQVLDFFLSALEIVQQVLKVLPREKFALTSSNRPITSLKPFIDLLPKGHVNMAEILSILPLLSEILGEIRNCLLTSGSNQTDNLQQWVTRVLGHDVSNENDKFLNDYVRYCYNDIIGSKTLAKWASEARHNTAIGRIAERVHSKEAYLEPLSEEEKNGPETGFTLLYKYHERGDSLLKTLSTVSRGRKIWDRIEEIISASAGVSYDSPFEYVREFLRILNMSEEQIAVLDNVYSQCVSSPDSLSVDVGKEVGMPTVPERPMPQNHANVARLQGLSLFSTPAPGVSSNKIPDVSVLECSNRKRS